MIDVAASFPLPIDVKQPCKRRKPSSHLIQHCHKPKIIWNCNAELFINKVDYKLGIWPCYGG